MISSGDKVKLKKLNISYFGFDESVPISVAREFQASANFQSQNW